MMFRCHTCHRSWLQPLSLPLHTEMTSWIDPRWYLILVCCQISHLFSLKKELGTAEHIPGCVCGEITRKHWLHSPTTGRECLSCALLQWVTVWMPRRLTGRVQFCVELHLACEFSWWCSTFSMGALLSAVEVYHMAKIAFIFVETRSLDKWTSVFVFWDVPVDFDGPRWKREAW